MRSGLVSGVSRPVLVWALVVLSACAPGTGQPTPSVTSSPSPTYVCTPGVSGGPATPFACEKERYDEQQKRAALEAEAISVYKRYWAEYVRLEAAGGTDTATNELLATTADPWLGDVMAILRHLKTNQWHSEGPESRPEVSVLREPMDGADLVLHVCQDSSNLRLVDANGKVVDRGTVLDQKVGLKRVATDLKVFRAEPTGVKTCPGQ